MRKLATILVLMITFSMVFAGAVSAQDVETVVLDENGDPVDIACPGEEVTVAADVTTETDLWGPIVEITVDPETGLEIDPTTAVMIYNGVTYTNEDGDWFYWDDYLQSWNWLVAWYQPGYTTIPGDEAELFVSALVTDLGPINVDAVLLGIDNETMERIPLDEDNYEFLSVPCRHCHGHGHGETVPMQATGSPLAVAALGLFSIIGGALYGKLR